MSTASSQNHEIAAAAEAMRRHALSFPETHEDFPWEEHRAVKVKGKAFLFMGMSPTELSFSVKLPQSRDIALMLPFAKPTGYGLGKSGWVSGLFEGDAKPPVDMLLAWLDESYRAIAPKKLVAQLATRQATPADVTTNVEPAKAAKAAKSAKPAGAAKAAKAAKPAKVTKAANAPARKAATKKAAGAARKARVPAG
jgi:predicted DNA-binding protein (MmcQ/YjbR family)